jgi:hypothetical protein
MALSNRPNMGPIFRPEGLARVDIPIKASVAFKALGGKFVSKDGTDDYKLAIASDGGTGVEVVGWCDIDGDFTMPAAITKMSCIIDTSAVFEMPADAVFTEAEAIAFLFKTCDISDTNAGSESLQSADIGTSTTDVLIIVGYDVVKQTVYVKLNPAQHVVTGV